MVSVKPAWVQTENVQQDKGIAEFMLVANVNFATCLLTYMCGSALTELNLSTKRDCTDSAGGSEELRLR